MIQRVAGKGVVDGPAYVVVTRKLLEDGKGRFGMFGLRRKGRNGALLRA